MIDDPDGAEGVLIDLSGLSLRDLDGWGESSLLVELRRVLQQDSDDPDAIAGFTNSV
jgi:FXSXX-COOH protein